MTVSSLCPQPFFVVLGATGNMKSACVAAAVLVAAANERSPAIYQLMFDHFKTKYGKECNGEQAPDATRAVQRTLTRQPRAE